MSAISLAPATLSEQPSFPGTIKQRERSKTNRKLFIMTINIELSAPINVTELTSSNHPDYLRLCKSSLSLSFAVDEGSHTCSIVLTDSNTKISCPLEINLFLEVLLPLRRPDALNNFSQSDSLASENDLYNGNSCECRGSEAQSLPQPETIMATQPTVAGSISAPHHDDMCDPSTTAHVYQPEPAARSEIEQLSSQRPVCVPSGAIFASSTSVDGVFGHVDSNFQAESTCQLNAYSIKLRWPCCGHESIDFEQKSEELLETLSSIITSALAKYGSNTFGSGCIFRYKKMLVEGHIGLDLIANFIVADKKLSSHDPRANVFTGLLTKDLKSNTLISNFNKSCASDNVVTVTGERYLDVTHISPEAVRASLYPQWMNSTRRQVESEAACAHKYSSHWKFSKNFSHKLFCYYMENCENSQLVRPIENRGNSTCRAKYHCFQCNLTFSLKKHSASVDCSLDRVDAREKILHFWNPVLKELRKFLLNKCEDFLAMKIAPKPTRQETEIPILSSDACDSACADHTISLKIILTLHDAQQQNNLRSAIMKIINKDIKNVQAPFGWTPSNTCGCTIVRDVKEIKNLIEVRSHNASQLDAHSTTSVWMDCFDELSFRFHLNKEGEKLYPSFFSLWDQQNPTILTHKNVKFKSISSQPSQSSSDGLLCCTVRSDLCCLKSMKSNLFPSLVSQKEVSSAHSVSNNLNHYNDIETAPLPQTNCAATSNIPLQIEKLQVDEREQAPSTCVVTHENFVSNFDEKAREEQKKNEILTVDQGHRLIQDFRDTAQLSYASLAAVLGLKSKEPDPKTQKFLNTTMMICRGPSSHSGQVSRNTIKNRRDRLEFVNMEHAASIISGHLGPEDRQKLFSGFLPKKTDGDTGISWHGQSTLEGSHHNDEMNDEHQARAHRIGEGTRTQFQASRNIFAKAYLSNMAPWLKKCIIEDEGVHKYQIHSEKILRKKIISEILQAAKAARRNEFETMSFVSSLAGSTWSVKAMRIVRKHLRSLQGNLSTLPSEETLLHIKKQLQEQTCRDLGMMPTRDGWRISLRNQVEREVLRYLETHRSSFSDSGGRVKGRTAEFNSKWQNEFIFKLTFDARRVTKKIYHTEVDIILLPNGDNIDHGVYQCQKPLFMRTVLIWMGKDTKDAVQANMKELFNELRDLEKYGIIFREEDLNFEGVLDGVGTEDDLGNDQAFELTGTAEISRVNASDNQVFEYDCANTSSNSHGLRGTSDETLKERGMQRVQIKFIVAADMAAEASLMGHGCHGDQYCIHCNAWKKDRTIPFQLKRTQQDMNLESLAQSFNLHTETFAALNLLWPDDMDCSQNHTSNKSRHSNSQSRRHGNSQDDFQHPKLRCYSFLQEKGLAAQTAEYVEGSSAPKEVDRHFGAQARNSNTRPTTKKHEHMKTIPESHGCIDGNMFFIKKRKINCRDQVSTSQQMIRHSPDYDIMQDILHQWLATNNACSPIVPAGTLVRVMVGEQGSRTSEWLEGVWPNYKNHIFPCVLHCKMRITECLFLSICDMVQNNGVEYVKRLNANLDKLGLGKSLVQNPVTKQYEKLTFLGYEASILLSKSKSNDQLNISNVLNNVWLDCKDNELSQKFRNKDIFQTWETYIAHTKSIWELWASIVTVLEETDPRILEQKGAFDTFERDCRKFVCLVQTQFHGDYCKSFYLHTLLCHAGPAMKKLQKLGLCLGMVSNSVCERRHEYGRRATKKGLWGGRWRSKLMLSRNCDEAALTKNITAYLTLQELMVWEYGQDFCSQQRAIHARTMSKCDLELELSKLPSIANPEDFSMLLSNSEVIKEANGEFCVVEDVDLDCECDNDTELTKMEDPLMLFSDVGSEGESNDCSYCPTEFSNSDFSDLGSDGDDDLECYLN